MRAILALGSNLGDRHANLAAAVAHLVAGGVTVDAESDVFETEPFGGDPTRFYLNRALAVATDLDPWQLLALAKRIEVELGRDLDAPRNAPRPIDIDLLFLEGTTITSPELTVPHPRMAGREFVRKPLVDLVRDKLGGDVKNLAGAVFPA